MMSTCQRAVNAMVQSFICLRERITINEMEWLLVCDEWESSDCWNFHCWRNQVFL